MTAEAVKRWEVRPVPGEPWWELECHRALMRGDVDRLAWLVRLAEEWARFRAGAA